MSVHKIKNNIKILTSKSYDKIRNLDENFLRKLYFYSEDTIQLLLIEQIFILKNWELEIEGDQAA